MLSKLISPGNRIEMTRPAKNRAEVKNTDEKEQEKKVYISQVYDILEDERLKIAMPMEEGKVLPLPLHARYDVCFYTPGGLYQAKAVITDRYKEDGLYVLEAELTSELRKFQRRQYYRLEHMMDLEYKIATEEEIQGLDDEENVGNILAGMKKGVLLDISGGGIRFATDEKIEKKDGVLVNINIGITREEICHLAATIVVSSKIDNREHMYVNRAEFVHLDEATRERIIRYVFDMERRMRKHDLN